MQGPPEVALMSNANPSHLLREREQLREQLRERIAKANDVMPGLIRSPAELAEAEARERQWREYNSELLSRSFSTAGFAAEYDNAQKPIHIVEDRYFDPDLNTLVGRLARSIRDQIACMDSIINRLDLVPEDNTVKPATSSTDARTIAIAEGQAALVRLAERLHLVVGQLRNRRESRPTLNVADEYDVQDLVRALLTLFFDDIRPEEWTPSYAGGASRIDFLLPQVETVVEIKKTRPSMKDRDLGEQLIIDIEKYKIYPGCRNIFCLVYDPGEIIKNPRGVENDLNQRSGEIITVRVLIVPKR
jgi:hypothetical protein